ncbi:hypothetical protein D3C79_617820 [compost metagenome]
MTIEIRYGLICNVSLAAIRPRPTVSAVEIAAIACRVASVAFDVSSVTALRRSVRDFRVSLVISETAI